MDCGHFQSRRFKATRYEPKNCAPQDTYCNRYQQGEQHKFAKYIDKTYGKGTADALEIAAHQICKRKTFELAYIIEEYKILAKQEAGKRGIKL